VKLYKTKRGPVLEADGNFRFLAVAGEEDWDILVNREDLRSHLEELAVASKPSQEAATAADEELLAPIHSQEVWAAGVTYFSSRLARMEESRDTGGGDFYSRVYEADRPELFLKSTPARVVDPGEPFRIRKDSEWDVPEPELTLFITASGKIVAYTVGNDVSSRSIEGENPLYLPQAKTYDDCACLGPCLFVPKEPLPDETRVQLKIHRDGEVAFADETTLEQMKRKPDELVDYLFRETSFAAGVFLMTGTGIVPSTDFTLRSGDEVSISIDGIGTLINPVA